jgi:hypothetical protein
LWVKEKKYADALDWLRTALANDKMPFEKRAEALCLMGDVEYRMVCVLVPIAFNCSVPGIECRRLRINVPSSVSMKSHMLVLFESLLFLVSILFCGECMVTY